MGFVRLLLALEVVAAHSSAIPGLPRISPEDAVRSFFAISGFYMALVLNEKYPARPEGNVAFWKNRVLRLYPLYLAVLAANLLVRGVSGGLRGYPRLSPGTALAVVAAHLTMLGQDALVFMGLDRGTGTLYATRFGPRSPTPGFSLLMIAPAWSLSIELAFYAIAPFVLRRGWKFVVGLALVSFALRIAGDRLLGLNADPWTYRFFPFELGTFLVGALAYHAYRSLAIAPKTFSLPPLAVYSLVWMVLFGAALVPLTGTVLATVVAGLPLLFLSTRDSKFDHALGELSYPIYLVHILAVDTLGRFHVHGGLPVSIVSLAVSALLVRLIDVPVDLYRQRFAWRHGAARPSDLGIAGEPLPSEPHGRR